MELLIALIPALPLAGFLFAVLVGPRLDRVPVHGHHDVHDDHGSHDAHVDDHGEEAHGDAHGSVDTSEFRGVPTEEEQAATSPHAGHADDLANGEGAAGVIPEDMNDGVGQPGHVTPGGERPRYLSWIVPTGLVGLTWLISMVVFASVIFGGNEYATNAHFAAAPASAGGFRATLRNATVAGRFNAGTAVYIAERTSLRMEYEGMVSGSETSHGGHLRISYLF